MGKLFFFINLINSIQIKEIYSLELLTHLLKLDHSAPMQREVDSASSALFINDPKKESGFQKLFYTHPPIAERVERLRNM